MLFDELGLVEPLLRAVRSEGYTTPTAIQEKAIPHVLAGKDLLGCAQTGTGKTAAFALPILQRLGSGAAHVTSHPAPHTGHAATHAGHAGRGGAATSEARRAHAPTHRRVIRAMILTPTRELAAQIGDSFRVYGQHTGLRHTVIFGGVKQHSQEQALRKGIDILVATPGRLLDLLNQRLLELGNVEMFVLDEADRMLDMGFIHDVRRVISLLPERRQTLLFSATMPREIQSLAASILHQPVEVRVAAKSPAAETVQQAIYFVDAGAKPLLLEHLLKSPEMDRALIFTRTKRGADRVVKRLIHCDIASEAIHSNKSQNARIRALNNFKKGAIRVLVASDIASRGIDVDDISHVINYDMPNDAETYVHRIGRTGRAGAEGKAVTFCCDDQRQDLKAIEKMLGKAIPVLHHSIKTPPADPTAVSSHRGGGRSHQRQGGSSGQNSAHGAHKSPAGGKSSTHASHPSAKTADSTAHTSHKTASPEQEKNNFWRGRSKSTRRLTAKPSGSRRRRR
ncbi:MAG: DEAD/DEAH box helicase [Phycisphaerae bacterium]|jgi:ATP-dependent RNA helicase RhlE